MPTPFASALVSWTSGKVSDQLFQESVYLTEATTVNEAGVVKKMSSYEPWKSEDVADLLKNHPLAISTLLRVQIVAGPAVFGRSVEMHTAWGNSSEPAPTTAKALSRMHDYNVHVYGGAADPTADNSIMTAPFNEARSDVLKAASFPMGGKIVLYYYFVEANFGTSQVGGNRFILKVRHEYELYGRN
jgi:hypothetical protein